jgi:hypothetical protein
METEPQYLDAKRLVCENINKIKIYECCLNEACKNQTELWQDCNDFSDSNKYYAKEDEVYRDGFVIDVAIKERRGNSERVRAVIEIFHTDRKKTTSAIDLYRLFDIGHGFNRRDIIAVSAQDVLNCLKENPDGKVWRLQNLFNYQTCRACFSKLI